MSCIWFKANQRNLSSFNYFLYSDADNSEIHPPSYTRWCEVDRAEKDVLFFAAELTNTTILVGDIPECDPDGHYSPVQSRNQKWICVDANGDQVESFEKTKSPIQPNSPGNMDCRKIAIKVH